MSMDEVVIAENALVQESDIGARTVVGPFADIRDSVIGVDCVFEHAQVKRCVIGDRVKAKHYCYLGDAELGDDVNIGAGVVIANQNPLDRSKNKTYIGPRSSIGANATIVAPVSIGSDCVIAAGSVITQDVPDGHIAFARVQDQVHKPRK